MKIAILDIVLHKEDPWNEIISYEVQSVDYCGCVISPNDPRGKKAREVSKAEFHQLLIYPFSFFTREKYREIALWMEQVCDLICALLHKNQNLALQDLVRAVIEHKGQYRINDEDDVEWILRCLTMAKVVVATYKGSGISFALSPSRIAREKGRKFAASIADDLTSLSERIRTIINHAPTVGTYRENILQNSLRKNLPERYHVATGFIFGLDRQIDILIYDRVDYAPLFREGDLVVVPPESVRAAIEVKTKLTSENLYAALDFLSSVSQLDDNLPPFFKGIFAFESELNNDTIYEKIFDFYTDLNSMSAGGPGHLICRPFELLWSTIPGHLDRWIIHHLRS